MRLSVFGLVGIIGAAVWAERQPYSRYESIVQRQMFGPVPEGFDPTKNPSEVARGREASRDEVEVRREQEKLRSAIHFSVINVTPGGETAVGFTDNSDRKEPLHYYLKVGETRDGWTVKEADAVAKSMTIVKDDVEVSLTLGGNSASVAGATQRVGGARGGNVEKAMKTRSLGSLLTSTPRAVSQDEVALGNTLRDRRRARLERERKQQELNEAEKAQREAAREAARKEQEAKEAEEKAIRDAERENSKRELAEIRSAMEKMRAEQEAKAQVQTLEETSEGAAEGEGESAGEGEE